MSEQLRSNLEKDRRRRAVPSLSWMNWYK